MAGIAASGHSSAIEVFEEVAAIAGLPFVVDVGHDGPDETDQ